MSRKKRWIDGRRIEIEGTPHVRSERHFTISTTFVFSLTQKHGLQNRDITVNTPTTKTNIAKWIPHMHSTSLAPSR